jgi:hypothetical protein
MLLKIPATRTPRGALIFVALIIKILSCNKKKKFMVYDQNDFNCSTLHLRWVKAHVGIHGNEMADLLAKRGTTLGTGPIEDLPIPAVNLKNTIKTHLYQKWKTMWKNHTKFRQTKLWFAEPDRNMSRDNLQRSKANLGQLVQFFTGHNNLIKHQFNIYH